MPVQRNLFYQYDIPADLTFGRFLDQQNLRGFASTSGSSTTTTATETSGEGSTPFEQVVVGDWLLYAPDHGTPLYRRVTVKGSSSSITVNSAWTLGAAGKALRVLPHRSGTGANDGWVYIGSLKNVTVKYALSTLGATNVRFLIQVKGGDVDATPLDLFDETLSATGGDSFSIVEPWTWLRVGVEETSGTGTDVIDVILLADDNLVV
jgi:hypothetical protein